MIIPLTNRVIATVIEEETTTTTGLILSEVTNTTMFFKAKVLRVSGKMDLDLSEGDIILVTNGAGHTIDEEGVELIIREESIVGFEG